MHTKRALFGSHFEHWRASHQNSPVRRELLGAFVDQQGHISAAAVQQLAHVEREFFQIGGLVRFFDAAGGRRIGGNLNFGLDNQVVVLASGQLGQQFLPFDKFKPSLVVIIGHVANDLFFCKRIGQEVFPCPGQNAQSCHDSDRRQIASTQVYRYPSWSLLTITAREDPQCEIVSRAPEDGRLEYGTRVVRK